MHNKAIKNRSPNDGRMRKEGPLGSGLASCIRVHDARPSPQCPSQVEERVIMEMAHGAGAKRVLLWVGGELSRQKALNKLVAL